MTHRVGSGESLSQIAAKYAFRQWRPIWNYNTKVQRTLGDNPDQIKVGTVIWIPRFRIGYDNLLRKLRALKEQAAAEGDRLRYELEAEHFKHKGQRVLFDLAGDVCTLVGTVALKAAQAARARKAVAAATGTEKAAAVYLANQETKALSRELKSTLKDKAINGVMTTVDENLGAAHKDLYLTQRKGLNAIRGVSLQKGKSLLDIADILLDYVSVSNVADGLTALWIGETPGKSYETAQQTIRESVIASTQRIDERVREFTRERDLVYG